MRSYRRIFSRFQIQPVTLYSIQTPATYKRILFLYENNLVRRWSWYGIGQVRLTMLNIDMTPHKQTVLLSCALSFCYTYSWKILISLHGRTTTPQSGSLICCMAAENLQVVVSDSLNSSPTSSTSQKSNTKLQMCYLVYRRQGKTVNHSRTIFPYLRMMYLETLKESVSMTPIAKINVSERWVSTDRRHATNSRRDDSCTCKRQLQ